VLACWNTHGDRLPNLIKPESVDAQLFIVEQKA
jgi:hypothetical protein